MMSLRHCLLSAMLLAFLLGQLVSGAPNDLDSRNYLPKSFNLDSYVPDGRIINGTLATANATKHQVSIRKRLNDGYFYGTGHICGGSLIAPNLVLSAAHCFVNYAVGDGSLLPDDNFIAVVGNLDRFNRTNTLVFDIESIVYAVEIFNLKTYENDIALLFLNDSVPANHSTVESILLNREPVADGTVCQVTGWGRTENGSLAENLMTLDVPIINTEVCANDSDFAPGLIREGMMCAGYLKEGERDACGGDSGGPLVGHGVLVGIVSWGIGCAEPKLPGVYTNVSFWSNWIDMQAAAKNITLPGGNATKPGDGGGGGAAGSSFSNSWLLTAILLITSALAGRIPNV